MIGNLSNQLDQARPYFDPANDAVPYHEMLEIDRWALARTARLIKKCLQAYEEVEFHLVFSALYNFCTVDLSAFYLDVLKDRLYTFGTRSHGRRSAQTALYHILDCFTRLIAPLLPFTAEEVYHAIPKWGGQERKPDSIHTLLFPKYEADHDRESVIEEWDNLLAVRESVSKALEEARQAGTIGNSLEARIRIHAGGDEASLLQRHFDDLRYIFIVSQVEVANDLPSDSPVQIEVVRANGKKCERCWNYSMRVGEDPVFAALCERCVPVIASMNDLG